MDKKVERLVAATWQDLFPTYPSLTLMWLMEEATRQLEGASPTGGPGMFLNDNLRRAGYIK